MTTTQNSGHGAAIAAAAKKLIGTKYLLGGKGPAGVDCSGLVWYSHKCAGLNYAYANTASFRDRSEFTKVDLPGEGDVVLFSGHMGIYCKSGTNNIISAQSGAGSVKHGSIQWFGPVLGYYRWKSTS